MPEERHLTNVARPSGRVPTLAVLALAAGFSWGASAAAPPRAACAVAEAVPDLIRSAEPGEFRLASGETVRPADIRLASAGEAGRRAAAWLATLPGTRVVVRRLSGADRWGVTPASVAIAGAVPIDLAELLVAEGLASVDAGERAVLCRPDLLAVEAGARQAKRGLWADPGALVEAADRTAVATAAGRFVVLEGRVASVGERRAWTYLNFGRDFARDVSVAIPRRTWTQLAARGVTAQSLRGHRVRVRGILGAQRGPTVELDVPDMLEMAGGDAVP